MECDTKLVYLPHEIVKRDDRTGNIQRGVENIREVIRKGIPLERVGATRSLLVGHGFLVYLIRLSEQIVYSGRIRATSF